MLVFATVGRAYRSSSPHPLPTLWLLVGDRHGATSMDRGSTRNERR